MTMTRREVDDGTAKWARRQHREMALMMWHLPADHWFHTMPDDEPYRARFLTHHDAGTGELVGTDDGNTVQWYFPKRNAVLTVPLDGESVYCFDLGVGDRPTVVTQYQVGEVVKVATVEDAA